MVRPPLGEIFTYGCIDQMLDCPARRSFRENWVQAGTAPDDSGESDGVLFFLNFQHMRFRRVGLVSISNWLLSRARNMPGTNIYCTQPS